MKWLLFLPLLSFSAPSIECWNIFNNKDEAARFRYMANEPDIAISFALNQLHLLHRLHRRMPLNPQEMRYVSEGFEGLGLRLRHMRKDQLQDLLISFTVLGLRPTRKFKEEWLFHAKKQGINLKNYSVLTTIKEIL